MPGRQNGRNGWKDIESRHQKLGKRMSRGAPESRGIGIGIREHNMILLLLL